MGASGCPAGRLLPVAGLGVLRSVRLLGALVRDRPFSFQGYCEPSVHRRPAPTRRAVAFRSDRSWRAPLLRFFPLQRFRLRRAIQLCHKPDDPASAIQSIPSPCWLAGRLRSCGFSLAQAAVSHHACAGPTRIMHRRSPVRRCSATRPNELATLPASSIRQRSWGSTPFAVLLLPAGPIAFWRRAPTCRFSSLPPR